MRLVLPWSAVLLTTSASALTHQHTQHTAVPRRAFLGAGAAVTTPATATRPLTTGHASADAGAAVITRPTTTGGSDMGIVPAKFATWILLHKQSLTFT